MSKLMFLAKYANDGVHFQLHHELTSRIDSHTMTVGDAGAVTMASPETLSHIIRSPTPPTNTDNNNLVGFDAARRNAAKHSNLPDVDYEHIIDHPEKYNRTSSPPRWLTSGNNAISSAISSKKFKIEHFNKLAPKAESLGCVNAMCQYAPKEAIPDLIDSLNHGESFTHQNARETLLRGNVNITRDHLEQMARVTKNEYEAISILKHSKADAGVVKAAKEDNPNPSVRNHIKNMYT